MKLQLSSGILEIGWAVWDQFIASLKKEQEGKEESEPVEETTAPEPPGREISWGSGQCVTI